MTNIGIYSINDSLYESAVQKYVKNNRCVLGWKMIYEANVNGVVYKRISGIDIVPGEYLELGRNHDNPIRLKIGNPDKITIDKQNLTIIVKTE